MNKINLGDYASKIEFTFDVPQNEGWPRSTNIAEIRFAGGSAEYPLMVRFFRNGEPDNTAYFYEPTEKTTYILPGGDMDKITSAKVWEALIGGANYPDKDRRSTGRAFYRLIRQKDNKTEPIKFIKMEMADDE